jgi:hypothetical protein
MCRICGRCRHRYLQLIPPDDCAAIFKPEVAPEVLSIIARAITAHVCAVTARWCVRWLLGLSAAPRFDMTIMMLERATSRELAKMFDAVSAAADGAPPGADGEEDVLDELRELRKRYDA